MRKWEVWVETYESRGESYIAVLVSCQYGELKTDRLRHTIRAQIDPFAGPTPDQIAGLINSAADWIKTNKDRFHLER